MVPASEKPTGNERARGARLCNGGRRELEHHVAVSFLSGSCGKDRSLKFKSKPECSGLLIGAGCLSCPLRPPAA